MKLSEVFTIEELIKELAVTVSCGGNLLMNVGPNKDGVIVPVFEERLRQMGEWLEVNGEAIYGTTPWYVDRLHSLSLNNIYNIIEYKP